MHVRIYIRNIFKKNAAKTSKIRFILFSLGGDEVYDWIERIPSIRLSNIEGDYGAFRTKYLNFKINAEFFVLFFHVL